MYFLKLTKLKSCMLLLISSITITILIQINCLMKTNFFSYQFVKKKSTVPSIELNLNLYENRADFSRNYRIFDFIFVADRNANNTNEFQVTLASQSSFDRLFALIELAENWQGPISLAVYAIAEEIRFLLVFIVHLRNCFTSIRNFVNFHLMIAIDDFKYLQFLEHNIFSLPNKCQNSKTFFDNLEKSIPIHIRRQRKVKPYPQNHLRNIARKNIQTLYMFLIDIDIVPNRKMAIKLNDFFIRNPQEIQAKIAYVIPTFEMERNRKLPETKTELLHEIDRKFARPFHQKTFVYNQFATNFSQWLICRKTESIIVSHFVSNYEFFYEPFYVAKDSVPVYDERFYGYGYTRNSQVYEMFLAGWKFAVLSPVFTIHWGLQSQANRLAWREKQNYFNGLLFRRVKQELLSRYNRSTKFT